MDPAPELSLPKSAAMEGVRDWGSVGASPAFSDVDYAGHRFDEFIGIRLPEQTPRRRKHHKHKDKNGHHHRGHHGRTSTGAKPSPHAPPTTPPSERVQFILGKDQYDEDDDDHRSHDIFCEMSELVTNDSEETEAWFWKETARWVKFEEDVEEGGERWSKPFVATLSLYSLFEVRKCLLSGSILLDCDATDMHQGADLIVENMVNSKQLLESERERLRAILLLRHKHQHEKKKHREGSNKGLPLIRSLADIGRKRSEPNTVSNNMINRRMSTPNPLLTVPGGFCRKMSAPNALLRKSGKCFQQLMRWAASPLASRHLHAIGKTHSAVPLGIPKVESSVSMSRDADSAMDPNDSCPDFKTNVSFMKKIPPGSEAANILVGSVDFLQKPVVGFLRLSKATIIGDLTEVPVPTRFLFVMLGPKNESSKRKYHEIGRSIATLMSDEVFHDVAYKAKTKQDLLAGVDEFLSNCTVLPPGEWDPTIRIEPPKSVPSQEGRKEGATPNGGAQASKTMDHEDHADPTLVRTGRLFGGLMDDIRRKAPWYKSDITDCFHVQCVASFVYLYFACLTPIITFGGLLGDATKNNMAAMESIMSGALCGVIYGLFSGQPLTILGSTGPVLVFETITFHFCHDNHLNYMSFRWWIGMWIMVFLIFMVAFDLSALVRYITRFTEESFAALISMIFIKEAFVKLFDIATTHPYNTDPRWMIDCACMPKSNASNYTSDNDTTPVVSYSDVTDPPTMYYDWSNVSSKQECLDLQGDLVGPDCHFQDSVFFFSVCVFFATFAIAWALKGVKSMRFFPTTVRNLISDFAVVISIMTMLVVDYCVGLPTPKLNVPLKFKPTLDTRGWIIHPFDTNPYWTCVAAILPALLAVILIFMDQQITAVIVNRKENKLKKGNGYHLDLLIVALLIGLCSALGLPWFVAATVLSITHVMSLKKESISSAPGERPQFLGVREQRVTSVLIFLMIGLSVLLTFILKFIPMPILYGIFLYMGVSSLRGVQLVNRILIVFMPPKYQPDYSFLRHVPLKRVHLFTFLQVLCLAILWVIKTIKAVSIVFPLMVLAMCFIRKAMDYLFTQYELGWLDDIMPEVHKREKEDEEDKVKAIHEDVCKTLAEGGGNVEIPLSDGNVMTIPVDKITYKPETGTINISEEMAETAVWRQIAANAGKEKKHRPKSDKKQKKGFGGFLHGASQANKRPTAPSAIQEHDEDDDDGIVLNLDANKFIKHGPAVTVTSPEGEELQSLMGNNNDKSFPV